MHIGIDLVRVSRVNDYSFRAESISKTLQEILNIDIPKEPLQLATWIAINEATLKSLDMRIQSSFRGIEVINGAGGRPQLVSNKAKFPFQFHSKTQISVSHQGEFVIAVAISRLKFCGFIKIMNLQARKLLLGRISSDTSPLQKIDIFSKTQ